MEKIGERIKKVRKEHGLTQKAFGELIGAKWYRIKDLESGKIKKFSLSEAKIIEIKLGINHDWLLTGEGEMLKEPMVEDNCNIYMSRKSPVKQAAPNIYPVPLISWVRAAEAPETQEWLPDKIQGIVYTFKKVGKRAFALKVKGDSMADRYSPGDIIIVDPDRECRTGVPCVILVNNKATFKIFMNDGDTVILKPLNPIHRIREIRESDNIQVQPIGTVVDLLHPQL
ncbi:MAG: helix-turn-helix domain-containing protein [Desulfobacteraceae bacterium]|nr:helix-turn-helix domain-containing protein [Desulfobacteraceae bacterium]